MTKQAHIFVVISLAVIILVGLVVLQRVIFGDESGNGNPILLADNGQASQTIVVAANASPKVRELANTLSSYLQKISNASFTVTEGDGKTGLAIGLDTAFNWPIRDSFDQKDPTKREDYILRSHPNGLYIGASTELGLERAVWDLLYRVGYRQYFPGPDWEIIPSTPKLIVAVDTYQHPAYYSRRIWYGFGPWPDTDTSANTTAYKDWVVKNRMGGGINLLSGHNYYNIIRNNQAEFDLHPEYLGSVDGKPTTKFCVSQPGLQKLVVDYALDYFKKNPAADSISMEPSDGAGWGGCGPEEDKLGSITNRALTLANLVAEEVNKVYPGKYVGMYAYNQHAPAPTIQVHPQVIINVATSFTAGYNTAELVENWKKQGATVGIREYYSVTSWDRDRPAEAEAGNLNYLAQSITGFYNQGARFLTAESGENWGPNGLGYYLASRWMWDVGEVNQKDKLVSEFLDKSFGPARGPMATYYQLLDGSNKALLSDDMLGRMFQSLDQAKKLTNDPSINKRLNDLVLYTHYLELWRSYSVATTDRQAKFEALIKYSYQIHPLMMTHSLGLYRDLDSRDDKVSIPAEAQYNIPEPTNPWKSSVTFKQEEIDQFLNQGLANHGLIDFTPKSYNTARLVRAEPLHLPATDPKARGNYNYARWTQSFYTWIESGEITLKVKTNINRSINGGTIKLIAMTDPSGSIQDQASLAQDKDERSITLKTKVAGLHRIEINDFSAGTHVTWSDGTPVAIEASMGSRMSFSGRWTLYFFVPKGTKTVGGYASGIGDLKDSKGRVVYSFSDLPNYFNVPVETDQQGTVWSFANSLGFRSLLTVPPYLSTSSQELLLPKYIVDGKELDDEEIFEPSPSPDPSPSPTDGKDTEPTPSPTPNPATTPPLPIDSEVIEPPTIEEPADIVQIMSGNGNADASLSSVSKTTSKTTSTSKKSTSKKKVVSTKPKSTVSTSPVSKSNGSATASASPTSSSSQTTYPVGSDDTTADTTALSEASFCDIFGSQDSSLYQVCHNIALGVEVVNEKVVDLFQ